MVKVIDKNRRVWGVSTGETGEYGVGDLVGSSIEELKREDDEWLLDGEPVFHAFVVDQGGWTENIHYISEEDLQATIEYYE